MKQLHLLPLSFLILIRSSIASIASIASSAEQLPPIFVPGDQQPLGPSPDDTERDFTLRHIFHHGTHKYPNLHRRLDVDQDATVMMLNGDHGPPQVPPRLRARSQTISIQRIADRSLGNIDRILDTGRMRGTPMVLDASEWTIDDIPGPNVTDRETVLSFARMAANAYVTDNSGQGWYEVGGGFNYTEDFGWENDGLRGHIFADSENQTVVIGVKGTSPAVFDGSGTTTNDKINDNLFFSCCCGQGGRFGWLQVCDCQTSSFQCNSTCVVEALKHKNRYYYAAQEIYRNVTELYPHADVWLAGHSLGGSTSSLVALTYGVPVVTFEAPGEAMPALRLGLPTPPGYHLGAHQQRSSTGGFHFGHTADPIYMGTCNTYSSVCTIAGYAMQSVCHTGHTCTYDTVKDYGWRVGAGTHRIDSVIKDVIEKYDDPANCKQITDCTDCFNWEFYESNHTDTTTTTSKPKTSSATRTSTCKTPGWWGCLDEDESTTTATTTTVTTTTTEVTTTTTTTCETPGWFGCKDPTTAVPSTSGVSWVTRTVSSPSNITSTTRTVSSPFPSTSTSTCLTPGWFGCNDPTSSPSISTITAAPSQPMTNPLARPTSTVRATPIASPSPTCVRRAWLGRCKEWSHDGGVIGDEENVHAQEL